MMNQPYLKIIIKITLISLFLSCFYMHSIGQCACTNCPVNLPTVGTQEGFITISGATSNTLNTTQFVKAVNINVEHDALRECEITLIAPNGSSVLLSDNSGVAFNNNITYNICILDCTGSPVPDPGFPINFTSNSNYMAGQTYTGSYFTYNFGCLSTLTGPVDGQWTLRFQDFIGADGGTLIDWSLEFADNTGTNCTFACATPSTCQANAPSFLSPSDLTVCEGDPSLNIIPVLDYTGNPPDPNLYSILYIISDLNEVVLDIVSSIDLTTYSPGLYIISVLSILTSDIPLLPSPNGSLVLDDIEIDIFNNIYCAEINGSLLVINIEDQLDLPITIEGPEIVCAGQLVTYTVNNPYGDEVDINYGITMGGFSFFQIVGDQVNVIWLSGPGTICVFASNTCGMVEDCITVNVNEDDYNPTIFGNPNVCTGQIESYQLVPELLPGYTVAWEVTNGGFINIADNEVTLSWGNAISGQVCATIFNNCNQSTNICFDVVINQLPPLVISMNATACVNGDITASIVSSPLYNSYNWTVTPGIINSGQGTSSISLSSSSTGTTTVCVEVTSDCGPPQWICQDIEITDPSIPDIIVVSQCGDFAELAIVNPLTGATWEWTQLSGPSLLSFGNPAFSNTNAVAFDPGTYVIQVTETLNGCIGTNTISVTFLPITTVDNVIGGQINVCVGVSPTYTLDPLLPPGFTNTWTISNGIILSQTDNSVFVLWNNSGSGQICYNITDPCGNVVVNCLNVTIIDVAPPPNFTLPSSACLGTNFQANLNDANLYETINWSINSGTILSGQGSGQITVSPISSGTITVCVDVTSNCSPPQSICQDIQINDIPSPNIAIFTQCGQSATLTASIPNGLSSYNWSQISGPGLLSFTTTNDPVTNVTSSLPGTYVIQLSETLNGCTGITTITITLQPDLLISNPMFDCNNANGYTVSFTINGGLSPYTVDNNSIVGNTFTSTLIPFGNNYSFVINDSEGCEIILSGSQDCPCVSDAGVSSSQLIEVCEDQLAIGNEATGSFLDFNDIGFYVLHDNPGNILGSIFSSNVIPEFIFIPTLQYGVTYYISFVVGNNVGGSIDLSDPCLSISLGQPIVFNQIPIPNAGNDLQVCGNTFTLNGSNSVTGSNTTWSMLSGSNVDIDFPELLSTQVTVNGTGVYQFLFEENNQGCIDSDVIEVQVFEELSTLTTSVDCDPNDGGYTVTFSISGGQAPYIVNGDPIVGNTYTSSLISSGSVYNFDIVDDINCFTAVQGIFNCDCTTQGGTMSATEQIVCAEGGSVTAIYNNDGILDADDVGMYVLHTSASNILGTVLATNQTGIFSYQPSFNLNTRYYISYVIGNNLNGSVDLSDICLGVSPGQPVLFRSNPLVNINPVSDTCALTNIVSINPQSGTNYTWSSSSSNLSFSNQNGLQSLVTASTFGSYEVILIANNDVCRDTATLDITFNQPVSFGPITYDCQDVVSFNANVSIVGTAPFTSSISSIEVTPNQLLFENLPSGSTTQVTITSINGCSNSTNLIFNCACQSTTGTMSNALLSACEGESVVAEYNFDGILGEVDSFIYILHTSPTTTLGTILETSAEGRFTKTSNIDFGTIYYISFVSVNFENGNYVIQPCSFVTAGQPVVFYQDPSLTWDVIVAPCVPSAEFILNSTFNVSNLMLTSSPPNANILGINQLGIDTDKAGIYIASIEVDNNGCKATFTNTFELFDGPVINNIFSDCTGFEFNTSFEISGGTAPYFLNGNTPINSPYTSENFASLTNFSFFVEDDRGCVSPLNVETKECACVTDAGSLNSGNITLCEGEDFSPTFVENFTLDNGDSFEYILHDGQINNIGNILLRTKTFPITYDPSYAGNSYILTRIVGQNNQNGEIDLTAACTDISLGIIVTWTSKPDIVLVKEDISCEGDPIFFDILNPELGILEVIINQEITAEFGTIDNKLALLNENIESGDILTYIFTDNDGCTYEIGTDVITFTKKPNAGSVNAVLTLCFGDSKDFFLPEYLDGQDLGGLWYLDNSNAPISENLSIDDSFSSNTSVLYVVTNECGVDTSEILIDRIPKPSFLLFTNDPPCFGVDNGSITILPSPPLDFTNITVNGNQISNLTLANLAPGNYEVVVTNNFGCAKDTTVTLFSKQAIEVDLGPDLIVEAGENVTISLETNLTPDEIANTLWTLPNNEQLIGKIFSVEVTATDSAFISVAITDINGCTITDEVLLIIRKEMMEEDSLPLPDLVLPNVIVPGSLSNGFFNIANNSSIDEVTSCSIYDRWGNNVYLARNAPPEVIAWDGTFGGSNCQPGVYVYTMTIKRTNGKEEIITGDITILR